MGRKESNQTNKLKHIRELNLESAIKHELLYKTTAGSFSHWEIDFAGSHITKNLDLSAIWIKPMIIKANAHQKVNVSEKTGIFTQVYAVRTWSKSIEV